MQNSPYLFMLALLAGALATSGCDPREVPPVANNVVSGSIASLELLDNRLEVLVANDLSGEAILIRDADTVDRQAIASEGYFDWGYFRFDSLPAGSYDLLVRKPGFISRYITGIRLADGDQAHDDLELYEQPPFSIIATQVELQRSFGTGNDTVVIAGEASLSGFQEGYNHYLRYFYGSSPAVTATDADFDLSYSFRQQQMDYRSRMSPNLYAMMGYQSGDTLYYAAYPELRYSQYRDYATETRYAKAGGIERSFKSLASDRVVRGWLILP